jgi:hypothetical protein
MPDRVSPRPIFARFGDGSGASEGITSVSFDLPKRCHSLLPPSAGAVLRAVGRPPRSSISAAKTGCEICIVGFATLGASVRPRFHNFMAMGSGLMLIPFHHVLSSLGPFDQPMEKI